MPGPGPAVHTQFRRNRLSEALIGALLALPAPAALAAACSSGVPITQYSGTGSGTLYDAFAYGNGCAEFSTTVYGGGGNQVSLDGSYTMSQAYTLYFDTAGQSIRYILKQGSGVLLDSALGATTSPLTFQTQITSGAEVVATVLLENSFQPTISALGSYIIKPAITLGVSNDLNVSAGTTVQLYGTGYGGSNLPTLQFSNPLTFSHGIEVLGAGVIDTNSQASTLTGSLFGSGNATVSGLGSLAINYLGGVLLTGNMTVAGGSTMSIQQGAISAPAQWTVNGTLALGSDSSTPAISTLAGTGSVTLGSKVLIINSGSTTFSGVLQGSGGLTVSGGTQVLSGANTYSGTTTISSGAKLKLSGSGSIAASSVNAIGTLDISGTTNGASIASLTGSGAVTLGSQTLTLTSASQTWAGNIQGTGGLRIAAGTETLTGSNSYTGVTTIDSAATLVLSGSAALGGTTQIVDNGSLRLVNDTTTLAALITGSGTLGVSGGVVTLTAANTYTGATTISAGSTLALTGGGSISASAVTDDGLLDISGTTAGTSVASVAGSGSVNLGAQTLTITSGSGTLAGSIYGTGGLTVSGGRQVLTGASTYTGTTTIDSGATLAFSGSAASIANPNLLAGNQTLGGVNTYTGGTYVQGGTLTLANGAALGSGLQVQSAGNAAAPASASIAGDVNNAGSLSVGAGALPSGTLTVAGSYTQSNTGTLTVAISPTTNATLQVNGAQLNLAGNLVVQAAPGNYLRQSYLLVNAPATTLLNGQFANWQVSGLSASQYNFSLVYIADPQVILNIVAVNPFNAAGTSSGSSNLANVGQALDTVVATASGALFDRLNSLFNQSSVADALQAIDGELYAATPSWLLMGTQQEWGRLFDRLGLGQGADVSPDDQAFAWINGSRSHVIGDGNALGLSQSASGLTLGRQIHRGAWALGAAAGTLEMGMSRNRINDGATAQLFRLGAFAGRPVGPLQLGTVLGYTQGQVGYGMAQRTAQVLTWQSRAAREFKLSGGNALTPMLSFEMQRLRLSGATESDPLLGLQVPSQRAYTSSTLAALRGTHAWSWHGASGEWSASLGVRHWFHRPPGSLVLSFNGIPGVPFTTWTEAPPRNLVEAGLGLHAQLRKQLSAEFSLQGEYGRSVRGGKLEAHLVWGF